jgi:hypothetical protein
MDKLYKAFLGEDAWNAEVKREAEKKKFAEQIEEYFKDHPHALKEWFRDMHRRQHYTDDDQHLRAR